MESSCLPLEILELILTSSPDDKILDSLLKTKYINKPDLCSHCNILHHPDNLTQQTLLSLRQTCSPFRRYLDPIIFHSLIHRWSFPISRLNEIANNSIASFVHTLRIEINPRHLFGRLKGGIGGDLYDGDDDDGENQQQVHQSMVEAGRQQRQSKEPILQDESHFFNALQTSLVPLLSHFSNARVLYLTMRHDDSAIAASSQGPLLLPYFQALCVCVREASLDNLEELQIGVPYEGGYGQDFFRDKRLKDAVKAIGNADQFSRVTVKLSDRLENYTIMPIL